MQLIRTSLLIAVLAIVGSEAPVIKSFSPFSIEAAAAGKFKPRHQKKIQGAKVKPPKPLTVKPPTPARVTSPKGPTVSSPKKVGFERKTKRENKPIVSKQDVRTQKPGILKGHFDNHAHQTKKGKTGNGTSSGNHNEASKPLTNQSKNNSNKKRRDENKQKVTERLKINPSPGPSGPGS